LLTIRNKGSRREDEREQKETKGLVPAMLATAHTTSKHWT
jgi:hypothetical protein